jgi:TolB protein
VVWKGDGPNEPGAATYRGSVPAPSGGWVAARVHGGTTAWPAMDSYPFAHTAPTWIGEAGSTEPAAAARAAKDLLAALDVAEDRIRRSYEGTATPELLGRIAAARQKLAPLAAVRDR